MKYDYIFHLETLTEDLPFILGHLNASDLAHTFPTNKLVEKNNTKYLRLFLNASFSALRPVLQKYRADAEMFGYNFRDYVRESDKNKLPWL